MVDEIYIVEEYDDGNCKLFFTDLRKAKNKLKELKLIPSEDGMYWYQTIEDYEEENDPLYYIYSIFNGNNRNIRG